MMADGRIFDRITSGAVEDFSESTLSASDIIKSTVKFFDEHFRGAVTVEGDTSVPGFVDISAKGLAYFYRTLLKAVFGKSLVRISMRTGDCKFSIHNEWSSAGELDKYIISELKNIARLSGFDFSFSFSGEVCSAEIVFKLKVTQAIPIYANSVLQMFREYIGVFFYT